MKIIRPALASSACAVVLLAGSLTNTALADGATRTLYASQDVDVGTLSVTHDSDQVCVSYELSAEALGEGWLIHETHLYVGATEAFPLTRENKRLGEPYYANPVPGQFPYGDDQLGGVPAWNTCIPTDSLGEITNDTLYVAAHAVISNEVAGQSEAVIYGTRTGGGAKGLYEIDAVGGVLTLLQSFDGTMLENGTGYSNGLAYDPDANTLYFTAPPSVNTTSSPLWYYVLDTGLYGRACEMDLPGSVVGAAWYDGAYYYIAEGTNTLVRFDVELCEGTTAWDSFGEPADFTFGDFAISSEGMLYGSTRIAPQFFFTIDLTTGEFAKIDGANALDQQLAFGSNGTLYGANHASGIFSEIDALTGIKTPLSLVAAGFADLASGKLFIPDYETAWADGGRFNTRGNWGMWFTYEPCNTEYEITVTSVNSNAGYKHSFKLGFDIDGNLGGTGQFIGSTPGFEETLSDFNYTLNADGDITYVSFKAVYPNGYTWYPAFDLIGEDTLSFKEVNTTDNVNAATGTWTTNKVCLAN
ncbi:hypothetical protein [Thioalkalivibrio sp. XN279]|uniref:hypothetical protein n=1 Tax=Thioalkalivibrio sp. XN279 TaxID=2714953 RepID=UPI00140C7B52|nr:hypothetical protein [Thioalkalivibrio sp. XN279]NHA14162.1 hypothetical protein [Thioalkalivibrio sp. XN279]